MLERVRCMTLKSLKGATKNLDERSMKDLEEKRRGGRIIHGPPYLENGFRVHPYIDEHGNELGRTSVGRISPEIMARMPRVEPKRVSLLRRLVSQIGENLGFR